jgi:hypothetical protein
MAFSKPAMVVTGPYFFAFLLSPLLPLLPFSRRTRETKRGSRGIRGKGEERKPVMLEGDDPPISPPVFVTGGPA